MNKTRLILSAVLVTLVPGAAWADLNMTLDFDNNGSDWSLTVQQGDLPLTFGLDGDVTKIGFEINTEFTGQYGLTRELVAPAGFVWSNIRMEYLASGYSSWIMDGRAGFGTQDNPFPLQLEYSDSFSLSEVWGGIVGKDEQFDLNASGDPLFTGRSNLWISVEVGKGLAGVWSDADVSQIRILADETAIVLGDMNFDGNVTTADSFLIVLALVDRPAYDALFPAIDADLFGDVDSSGTFDLGDLGPFSALLGGPASASAVPEPASASILIVALGFFTIAGYRHRRR